MTLAEYLITQTMLRRVLRRWLNADLPLFSNRRLNFSFSGNPCLK
jgi:hypothetical protein